MEFQAVFAFLFILINCGYCFHGPEIKRNTCSNIFQLKIDMKQQKFGIVTIPRTTIRKTIELVIVFVVNARLPKVNKIYFQFFLYHFNSNMYKYTKGDNVNI